MRQVSVADSFPISPRTASMSAFVAICPFSPSNRAIRSSVVMACPLRPAPTSQPYARCAFNMYSAQLAPCKTRCCATLPLAPITGDCNRVEHAKILRRIRISAPARATGKIAADPHFSSYRPPILQQGRTFEKEAKNGQFQPPRASGLFRPAPGRKSRAGFTAVFSLFWPRFLSGRNTVLQQGRTRAGQFRGPFDCNRRACPRRVRSGRLSPGRSFRAVSARISLHVLGRFSLW